MDPGIGSSKSSKDVTTRVTEVTFHSPFDAADRRDSGTLITQVPVESPLWDVAVRRFSAPSVDANRQRLAANIDSARIAYAKAFVAIQKTTKNLNASAILQDSSERDVAQTALDLFNQPSCSSDDRGHVSRLVDILHHYHGVFDVLSQADFSYLAVIWGGMKLLLIMAKNRKELLTKLTDMLVEIGLTLSRIEVYAKLFPTARMIELTSMLYAAVVDFLKEVIVHLNQRKTIRKMLSSFIRPFDEKFGHAMARIHRLESCIEKDAILLHTLQTASMTHHHVDSYLQRHHVESTLTSFPSAQLPHLPLLQRIKSTLFHPFPEQSTYHESLAATYSVTAHAWEKWFAVEQRYLPSSCPDLSLSPSPSSSISPIRARLSQGLCDAPDYQHALQWLSQHRRLSPDLPAIYLIWAPGMTVHTAIASLIMQLISQRPASALSRQGMDVAAFVRASTSVRRLWEVFVYLMRVLGGGGVYLSIGSAGEEEFAVVERFVRVVRGWEEGGISAVGCGEEDGEGEEQEEEGGIGTGRRRRREGPPPMWVTIVHPNHHGFVGVETATDLDGLYDVHPSLTTTDALHHVLMVELDLPSHQVSTTIQNVLWEAVWRETRYASISVCVRRVTEAVMTAAEELGRSHPALGKGDAARELWMGGVQKWITNPAAANSVREQIQRHLDIVDLALPSEVRAGLSQYLKRLVLGIDDTTAESFASRSMTQIQRNGVWESMSLAIVPGAEAMFCESVRNLVEETLEGYCELPPQGPKQAGVVVLRLFDERFGMDGTWKESMSRDANNMVRGIVAAIEKGFAGTIEALSEPEDISVE